MSRPDAGGGSDPADPRVLCVCGPSGAGKTTLLRRLLPRLSPEPGRIGLLKHTHHALDWHPEGTDSGRLWETGAAAVVVSGPDQRAAFVRRRPGEGADRGGEGADRGGEGAERGGEAPVPAGEEPVPAATAELLAACAALPPGLELVLAEGFHRADAPKLWVAAGPPGPDPLPAGVVAVAAAGSARAAWQEAGGGVPVYSRDAPGELASLVEDAAVAASEIRRGWV